MSNQSDFENVSLDNIGKGAALELFDHELQKVIQNISDLNTKAQSKREIKLTVKFEPNEERETCGISITCSSKLAPIKPADSYVHVVNRQGTCLIVQDKFKQDQLFKDENVTPIKKEALANA